MTFTKLNGWNGQLDVFLVGGGGDGGKGQKNSDTGGYWSGAGGGSGFTTTESVIIKAGVDRIIAYPFPPLVEMHKLLVKLRFMETMARVTVVVMADRVAEKPGWAAAVQAVKVV